MPDNPSTQPLYYQILMDLRYKIETGEIAPGERLPTEKELTETYGASRVTIRRALAELNELGITEHRGKHGHFAIAGIEPEEEHYTENNLFEQAQALGKKLSSQILSSGTAKAVGDVAVFFGVEVGTPLAEAVCLRTIDGKPFGIERLLLPGSLIGKIDFTQLEERPLVQILSDEFDIDISNSTQTLTPQIPTSIESTALKAPIRKPLLLVSSRAYDVEGRPTVLSDLLYNTDAMEYKVTWTKR